MSSTLEKRWKEFSGEVFYRERMIIEQGVILVMDNTIILGCPMASH
jgi:hypothetical protein